MRSSTLQAGNLHNEAVGGWSTNSFWKNTPQAFLRCHGGETFRHLSALQGAQLCYVPAWEQTLNPKP
jgi:hypothetical protein